MTDSLPSPGVPSDEISGTAHRPSTALRWPVLVSRAVHVFALTMTALLPAAFIGLMKAAFGGRPAVRRYFFACVSSLLMKLGPTFVKAGQVLSTRRDVLPADLCDELSVLQDSVTPLDHAYTRRAFAEAYMTRESLENPEISMTDVEGLFAEIGEEPIASGSVACVYRCSLRGEREVAVKLRRPGIERVMTLDLALMRRSAALVARLPAFRGMPVSDVVDRVCDAVIGQLDFAREANSLARLRDNLACVPRVWVPQVHMAESRPCCIVMEYIPYLDPNIAVSCPVAMRKRFAASALTAIYQMLFVDGFVHCDMHPGNLYFTRAGQVVVLDAGFSVQLSERLRRLFAEFFMNMATGRGRRCADIVIESSAGVREDADLEGFIMRMANLVERSHGLSAKEFSLMAFATEMFDLQRKFGIHAAPELIFPLLSLLVIEGTIRELDPDIDFQETARPALMRGLFGQRISS